MAPFDLDQFAIVLVLAAGLGVVLGFAWTALTAPIRCRLTHWQSADSRFEPCQISDLTADVASIIASLEDLGFIIRGHWQHAAQSPAWGQITMMEHPQTLDVAKIVVAEAGRSRQVALAFQTRFEDGMEIVTANNRSTVGLPPLPEITGLWLPEVGDTTELYSVHTKARDYLDLGRKRLSIGPDPVAFLIAGRNRAHAHWVAAGYWYHDESHGVYRPTWKGACLMTWRVLRPVRPLYHVWRRRPTRRLLRELGIRLEID